MYTDNNVRLIIGKIDIFITFEVVVNQGYIVATLLFLFIMMTFAETIEKYWVRNDLKIVDNVRTYTDGQISQPATLDRLDSF